MAWWQEYRICDWQYNFDCHKAQNWWEGHGGRSTASVTGSTTSTATRHRTGERAWWQERVEWWQEGVAWWQEGWYGGLEGGIMVERSNTVVGKSDKVAESWVMVRIAAVWQRGPGDVPYCQLQRSACYAYQCAFYLQVILLHWSLVQKTFMRVQYCVTVNESLKPLIHFRFYLNELTYVTDPPKV